MLNKDFLNGYFPKHSSQIEFITVKEEDTEYFANKMLPLIKQNYDYIFIDIGDNINDKAVKIIEGSNVVFMVVQPDIISFKNAEYIRNFLNKHHFQNDIIKVIINEYDGSIQPVDFDKIFKSEVVLKIERKISIC